MFLFSGLSPLLGKPRREDLFLPTIAEVQNLLRYLVAVLLVLAVMLVAVAVQLDAARLVASQVFIQGVIAPLRAAVMPNEEYRISAEVTLAEASDAMPEGLALGNEIKV